MPHEKPTPLQPIVAEEFDQLIDPFGPFESDPRIAVGVSGGADSLCLVLLLNFWLRRHQGRVVALIVDHGLRRETKREIKQLAKWLTDYKIEHHVLVWDNQKPRRRGQAAARDARYRLLTGWCRGAGVLHLALAHHRDDQVETLILRKDRGSGSDGMASMPIVWEQDNVRLLRPLLPVPGERLRATLRSWDQCWVEDPSNDDPAFDRTHIRRKLAQLPQRRQEVAHIADMASEYAVARAEADEATAAMLSQATQIDPAGFCWLDHRRFLEAPASVGVRGLMQIILAVGGNKYGPRRDSLLTLYETLRQNQLTGGRTLGGCYIAPCGHAILLCREPCASEHVLDMLPGQCLVWDHRFQVTLLGRHSSSGHKFMVRRLGEHGWCIVKRESARINERKLPLFVRYSLPALWDLDGLVAVPHLNYRGDAYVGGTDLGFAARFRPRRAFAGPAFRGVDSVDLGEGNFK